MNEIYLDNAATTPCLDKVVEAMNPFFTTLYANPSSPHSSGRVIREVINLCREDVASSISANSNEIYFTSCGSESNNWALRGIAEAYKHKGNHIITSKIEHHSILNTCKYLEENGFVVTYLNVNHRGEVDLEQLEASISENTILISIMTVNNELGTIQDINHIGEIAHKHNVLFHTDAVQAYMKIPINIDNIDLLSASGHKIGAPKGIGFLYVKNGIEISNLIFGGSQEFYKRAGTENVPYIVGLSKAVKLHKYTDIKKSKNLLIQFIKKLDEYNINYYLNSPLYTNSNGTILNISFPSTDSDSLIFSLGRFGIYVSSGSACANADAAPSHVLEAIGLSDELINSSIRISISDDTTSIDMDEVARAMHVLFENDLI